MKKTRFDKQPCPIARSLDRIGEWWSMLIIRDAFHGLSKFDEFQQSLGLSPTILSRRLKFLVESGIFYKRSYQQQPLRYEYLLTESGEDLFPVLATLLQWGNTHLAPEGIAAQLVDRASGQPIHALLIDEITQQPINRQNITLAAGPAASSVMRQRAARMQQSSTNVINESSKESL
ncbi:winged helix-turn-helix transcriptional regulator [Serratia sp. NPDC078593]|uniref:winged helix-turn-helix transcriptional regulator n=1 Tax=unclassified Serratia (in: enterobacteria) TaxID=2647522 RepID=UPI0037CCE91E